MKNSIRLVALGMLWWCFTLWLFSSCSAYAVEGVPSWKKGISAWSGKGYMLPPSASTAQQAAVTSPKQAPYTMPVDPAVYPANVEKNATADLAWLENFASADSVAKQPLAAPKPSAPKPLTSTDGTIAQVSGEKSLLEDPLNAPINLGVIEESQIDSITQRIESGQPVDAEAPLQQDVMRWYQYPWVWMTTGWTNHAEFGLDGSQGNAETLALTTGLDMKRKTEIYTLGIDVDYRQASNRGVSTQDNGRFNLDYDRIIADSKWSVFGKFGLEWDKFKAFDLRLNTNAGLGYYWIKDDKGIFITRFGAGASKEIGAPDDDWVPEAVLGAEAERQITERQKIKGKVEYFPAWNDFSNYRLVADASWEVLLDGSDNLSLKLSATDRYDSTPQGALANDIYYSALILYKF